MTDLVLYYIFVLTGVLAYKDSDTFISCINSKQNLWKAGRNFDEDVPLSSLKGLLGLRNSPKDVLENVPLLHHGIHVTRSLPKFFDARTKWYDCQSIGEIADQSACGSCWAVSTASTISDRICIHSDAEQQPRISARNLLSCSPSFGGCLGGDLFSPWSYWLVPGIVTGGAYGSNIGCQPYPFAQCEHHTDEGSRPVCQNDTYPTPPCVKVCDNPILDYHSELYYADFVYRVPTEEHQIQAEILKNGPVVAGFTVYEDFFYYKSGVYVRTVETPLGKHAVRVIGWGVENGTKYWLVANSWNEDWGDKGFFKIRRGVNECEFESQMIAGLPRL